MTHLCGHCRHIAALTYVRRCDEYLCEDCERYAVEDLATRKKNADHIDGYDRDDLGESPDY